MKRLTQLSIGLVSIAFLFSCTSSHKGDAEFLEQTLRNLENLEKVEAKYKTVEIDDLYTIEIPEALTVTTGLNDDASLEYANNYDQKFIIVIEEDKQEFVDLFREIEEYDEDMSVIDNYFAVQSTFMDDAGGTTTYESGVLKKQINGMEARQRQFDGYIPGIEEAISYWVGYIEGEERLYTIMAWTLESRKDDFKEEAHKMIKSLVEL